MTAMYVIYKISQQPAQNVDVVLGHSYREKILLPPLSK